MSELIQKHESRDATRWMLLAGVSTLALTLYISSVGIARAEDRDRPQVWVEVGGQLSRLQNGQQLFEPPFVALTPSGFSPPQNAEKPPRYGINGTAALIFQPKGMDWNFSASIDYGRASSNKHDHHQTYPSAFVAYQRNKNTGAIVYRNVQPFTGRFTDAVAKQSETHAIVDFRAGKDVGLGLFGEEGASSLNVGVRFAQFQSKSRASLAEDPDWHFSPHVYPFGNFYRQNVFQPYHTYAGAFHADRSFHGIGPSLSLTGSKRFAGSAEHGSLTLDWGASGSLLFGRQKARTQHHTTALYHAPGVGALGGDHPGVRTTLYRHPTDGVAYYNTRSRSVVVPNIGAFAGLSVKYPNAKVSFGYKADFFFGAMDGGIDVRRTEDVGFHGPYASVSIGLGG